MNMALGPHLTKRARRLRLCALRALSDPLPVISLRVHRLPSALPSAWLRALMRIIIARSHAQCRDWRQPNAPAASNCAGHAHAKRLH